MLPIGNLLAQPLPRLEQRLDQAGRFLHQRIDIEFAKIEHE